MFISLYVEYCKNCISGSCFYLVTDGGFTTTTTTTTEEPIGVFGAFGLGNWNWT